MKILLFTRALTVGGSERQLALLANGLAAQGHDVELAVLYAGGALEPFLRSGAVGLLNIGKTGRWNVLAPVARLARLFRTERYDVVYAFLPTQTTLTALLLPRRVGTRLVFGLRAGTMDLARYDSLYGIVCKSEAWLSRRADLIIANAGSVRSEAIARGLPGDRIAIVRNGIDSETMRPDAAAGIAQRRTWQIPDDALVIGKVARLDPMKDHRTFLAAAAAFSRDHPQARFVCVGDGPARYRDELMGVARSLGIDKNVLWAGEIAQVGNAYNSFDIATLSSSFGEGFPNVIAEAMACGIPVVATDVGDVRPIVGRFGEVVPKGRPDLLCAGWSQLRQRIKNEPDLRRKARDHIVANFTVESMVRRTDSIFTMLCAGRPASEVAREFA